MATITKGLIGKADQALWDGKTGTYTRNTITGGSETLRKNDWIGVDALEVFGSGTTQTDATLNAAIAAIGSSKAELFLSNGTWTISNSVTFPSTLTARILGGVTMNIATGVTVTFGGGIIAPPDQQIFSLTGSGSVVFSTQVVYPVWWGDDDTKISFYVDGSELAYVDSNGFSQNMLIKDVYDEIIHQYAPELIPYFNEFNRIYFEHDSSITVDNNQDLNTNSSPTFNNLNIDGSMGSAQDVLFSVLDFYYEIIHQYPISLIPYLNRYTNFYSGTNHDVYSEA